MSLSLPSAKLDTGQMVCSYAFAVVLSVRAQIPLLEFRSGFVVGIHSKSNNQWSLSLLLVVIYCVNERETADRSLQDKAAEYITRAFPTHAQFYPENLFIATWNEVGYYDSHNDKVCHRVCVCVCVS